MASDDNNRSLVEHQSEGQQNGAGSMTGTPSKNPMPSTFPQATNGHSPREKQISSDETVVDEHQDDENANNDQDSDMILSDLPEFDWVGFLRKWEESFKAATNEENELLSHFQHLSETFWTWAEVAGLFDNERAWKRIKTRERYVQIAEDRLDEKKRHYTQVVQAFERALQMLQS